MQVMYRPGVTINHEHFCGPSRFWSKFYFASLPEPVYSAKLNYP